MYVCMYVCMSVWQSIILIDNNATTCLYTNKSTFLFSEVANLYLVMIEEAITWGCTDSNVYNVNIGGLNDDPWYSFSCNQVDDWGRAFRSFR